MEKLHEEYIDDNELGIGSEIVRRFLAETTSPEHIGLFTRANIVLTALGVEFLETESENAISRSFSTAMEPSEALEELEGVFKTIIVSVFNELGIRINNEMRFMDMVPLLESVHAIEEFELSEEILLILDSEGDNISQLIGVIGLVGGTPQEALYADIWGVDDRLIMNIKKVHTEAAETAEEEIAEANEEEAIDPKIAKRLRAYIRFLKTDQLRFMRLIRNGLPLFLPFETYIAYFSDSFNEMEDPNVAVELFGLYLISQEYSADPVAVVDPYFERILTSANRSQNIRTIIRNVSGRFARFLEGNS